MSSAWWLRKCIVALPNVFFHDKNVFVVVGPGRDDVFAPTSVVGKRTAVMLLGPLSRIEPSRV